MNTPTERTSDPGRPYRAGRGRDARVPTGIPAAGWKDIALRVYRELTDDRVLLIAAGVTFYLLLALAPLLGALVSVYGLFLDAGNIAGHAEALAAVIPGGAVDILTEQVERLAGADEGRLGFAFVVSLGIALWSANAGIKALFQAMNVAYDESEDRGFVRLTLVTLAFTVSIIAGVIALVVCNTVLTTFPGLVGLSVPDALVHALTAAIALAALIVFMACLYRFGPSRESPRWAWITPGAVFAGIMIVVVSALFSWYVANFGSYNETYGSLGAVVGFLTWLWLVTVVLITSAELNAEMEHQTARDTTTGAPEPMGERGARVADDLGNALGAERG